jgi:Raf kinase inhibitor-like YbhB/YbcL family protein
MRSLLAFVAATLLSATAGARDAAPITVKSPAFAAGGAIPLEYTCDGRGMSPPISWSALPEGTKSVAVIVDDPDAPGGTFTHLAMFNLPPSQTSLPSLSAIPAGVNAVSAKNSSGSPGFTPICPPGGGRHHYRFQVLALDTMLPRTLTGGVEDVTNAMKGHVLARGELTGVYQSGGLPK